MLMGYMCLEPISTYIFSAKYFMCVERITSLKRNFAIKLLLWLAGLAVITIFIGVFLGATRFISNIAIVFNMAMAILGIVSCSLLAINIFRIHNFCD